MRLLKFLGLIIAEVGGALLFVKGIWWLCSIITVGGLNKFCDWGLATIAIIVFSCFLYTILAKFIKWKWNGVNLLYVKNVEIIIIVWAITLTYLGKYVISAASNTGIQW